MVKSYILILEESKGELDLLYLIMKSSPVKYDNNLVNKKLKTLNKFYDAKKKYEPTLTKTDEIYFKYNLLYGTKSNDLIRAYSPKMRPQSATMSNLKKDNLVADSEYKCFTEEEVNELYEAKCADLNLRSKDNLGKKFHEYCSIKCVNREADFNECNFKKNCAEVLSIILANNEKVSNLKLSKNCLGDQGVEILMNTIRNSFSIVNLDLSSNDITHRGGDILFESLMNQQSIISLNLSSLEGINRNRLTAEGVKKIETLLQINHFLEFMYLSGNSLKSEGLKFILQGLNNNLTLHVLDISKNEINSTGISYFSSILKQSKLTQLNLKDNSIGDEGINIIGECINDINLNNITHLNLTDCNITFKGAFNFFLSLQNNKRLLVLNLSNNKLNSHKFSKLKSVFGILNLRELKLSKCKLGNSGAIAIAEGFSINNNIKILDISDNRIEDKGFSAFSNFPISNYSLQKLDVSKNLITDVSCLEFVKNLLENTTFKSINFYDNQIRNETGAAFIDVLRQNKNITQINLKFTRIQMRLIEEINRLLKKNSENCKQNHIPNLKKEIRQIYVTNDDFDQYDSKIQETGNNFKNLIEKLNEDSTKYAKLKQEEQEKVNEIEEIHYTLDGELKETEEKIFKYNQELHFIQYAHNSKNVILQREINTYSHSIKILETTQIDLKFEQENVKLNFEAEVKNTNVMAKNSEKLLNYAKDSAEMLAKELINKQAILDKLENASVNTKDNNNNDKENTYKRKSIALKGFVSGLIAKTSEQSSSSLFVKKGTINKEKDIAGGINDEREKINKKIEKKDPKNTKSNRSKSTKPDVKKTKSDLNPEQTNQEPKQDASKLKNALSKPIKKEVEINKKNI